MDSDHRYLDPQLPHLSDDAAVAILDFLQDIVLRFESYYGGQIHRYYEQRSCHNIIQHQPSETTDPPF